MKHKLNFLKYFLWWIGIIKACPKCGSGLVKVDKTGWVLYKCSNSECDFGKKRHRFPFEIWSR